MTSHLRIKATEKMRGCESGARIFLSSPLLLEFRDRDDLPVLTCGCAAGADAIVTGDNDYLTLKAFELLIPPKP